MGQMFKKHPSIVFSLFAVMVTISGWVYVAGARASDMERMNTDIEEVKEKSSEDHDTIIEIRQDVKWIKERLK